MLKLLVFEHADVRSPPQPFCFEHLSMMRFLTPESKVRQKSPEPRKKVGRPKTTAVEGALSLGESPDHAPARRGLWMSKE